MQLQGSRDKCGNPIYFDKIDLYDTFITNEKRYIITYDYQKGVTKITTNSAQNQPNTVPEKQKFLVLMTLFYNETNIDLEYFYNFYRKQGVEKFYMFYNGKLSERLLLPFYNDVEYIEWDYVYWYQRPDPQDPLKHHKFHHAQTAAMSVFYYKYSHNYSYCIFCDTDEFIIINDNTTLINQHLKSLSQISYTLWYPQVCAFLNKESNQIHFTPRTDNEVFTNTTRSKCIHPGIRHHSFLKNIAHVLPVHGQGVGYVKPDTNGFMYHIKLKNSNNTTNTINI